MATTKKKTKRSLAVIQEPHDIKAGEIWLPLPGKSGRRFNISYITVDKFRKLLMPLRDMLRDGEVTVSTDSATRISETAKEITDKKTAVRLTKDPLCDLYYSFSSYLGNLLAVAKADKRYDDAWQRLILNFGVDSTTLKRELGRDPQLEITFGWVREIVPEVLLFPVKVLGGRQWYNRNTGDYEVYGTLTLDAPDRKALADLFFGKDFASHHLTDSLPEGNSLTVEDFEQETVTDLMTLDGVALNGSMLGANGSMSAAAVKKVKNQTQIRNFTHLIGKWPIDRVEMLCLTYFTYIDCIKSKEGVDIKKLAKFAVDTMPRLLIGPIFNTFMPAWQGFTRSWTSETYADSLTNAVKGILTPAAGEWIHLDNFKMLLMCTETHDGYEDMRCLYLFPYYKGREKANLIRRIDKEHEGDKGWKVKDIDWFEDIGFMFAVHWLKYLCALGMVELAIDAKAVDRDDDPMEGIRYARLTPLGRYAFDIDRKYSPKAAEANADIEFDAQNGIITIHAKSPFQMFLSTVAKRISPTRFSISAETLLKGCRRKSEVEQRIKNLQVIIDSEKEPALKKIIDEAMSHTDCAQREGGYSMLKLRVDLPGLREAILTNKELREMTILAGPTLALVKTHKMDRFNTILASYGFLMD